MTSRERVLAALNHRQPDQTPIDFSGHRSSGIAAVAYPKLRRALGFPECRVRVYDPIQQLAILDEDVLHRFRIDTIELGRAFALEDKHWTDWTLPDGTPCQMPAWALPEKADGEWVARSKTGRIIGRMPPGVLYFEQAHYPFADGDDLDNIKGALDEVMWSAMASPPGPLADGPEGLKLLSERARQLRLNSDRLIIGLFGGNLLEIGQFLYRNDNFLMLLASDAKRAHQFLDKLVEIHLAGLERFLGAVGPWIDVVLFGDDLGMQRGPQISPAMYREFFQPRHKLMWARAHELANIKVMLHCCGGVRELLPLLIEAGLDAINPVQITCRGMNPKELKREFGRDVTFWGGGCDTRDILAKSSPAEVRRHVLEMLEIWTPEGGFVFQQVHNILANIPAENIIAMFDAVSEFDKGR